MGETRKDLWLRGRVVGIEDSAEIVLALADNYTAGSEAHIALTMAADRLVDEANK